MSTILPQKVEISSDKYDLRPMLQFVEDHLDDYNLAMKRLANMPQTRAGIKFAERVHFFRDIGEFSEIIQPQLSIEKIKGILGVMPESLVRLSRLNIIEYINSIPVPKFNGHGESNGRFTLVDYPRFPRPGKDHPTKLFLGRYEYNGEGISLTPLPKSVSRNNLAGVAYQTNRLLHLIFHTVEHPLRDNNVRRRVVLETDGKRFSFYDFMSEFGDLYVKEGLDSVSLHSSRHRDRLNLSFKKADMSDINFELAEQAAEAFGGYMLNIVPNAQGNTDFRQAHPREWGLMDRLCRAKVVKIR